MECFTSAVCICKGAVRSVLEKFQQMKMSIAMQIQPWSWLYAVCFLDLFGASMIMPVFSAHLRSLGVSHVDIGLLSSLYGITQLISGPVIGSWSDVHGRRSILCLSMIISSLAYGLMGIVSSFYLFFIIRLLLGSFKHTQTLCRAFVSDIVPSEKQASVLGLMNAFTSFSFMLGPVISGHVMEYDNGFQYLCSAVLLIFVLNTTVVFLFAEFTENLKENNKPQESNKFSDKIMSAFKELCSIDWKKFWAFFCIKFLFGMAGFLFFQNMGVILTENFEVTPRNIGYVVSFYGFISGLCNLSTGRIRNLSFMPKNNLSSATFMFALMAATFFSMYILNSYIVFIISLVPLASSHSLTRIFLTEVILEQSDSKRKGSMVGASGSIAAIARIISPLLSGLVIARVGAVGALAVSSFIATCACLLCMVYSRQVHLKKA